MNQAKFDALYRGQTSVAKKVYESVPIQEAMTAPEVCAEMRRVGSNADLRVVAGCLCSLLDSGLVQERPKGNFIRTPVRAAEVVPQPPKEEKPMQTVSEQPSVIDALDTLTGIAKRVELVAGTLKGIAQDIENAAIEIVEQGEQKASENQKLLQLKELLKSL